MKKKLCLLAVFLLLIGFSTFGEDDEEEIGFLLFMPNSSSQFVNEGQAKVQLDNLAKYFSGREIAAGQINIYGYAAIVPNEIDPVVLSKNRALFVIGELQKRGVQRNLFSDPVAYGEVNLWGSNASEESRQPNRRARVVLDGFFITVEHTTGEVIESEVSPVVVEPEPEIIEEVEYIEVENKPIASKETKDWKFPWWLLLPLLLLLIPFLLSKRKKGPKKEKPPKPQKAEVPAVQTAAAPFVANEKDVVAASAAPTGMAMPIAVMSTETGESVVYLEEEIRRRAYEHYINRNGENGTKDGDWYKALPEICAKYKAVGYKTYSDGSWWAKKTFSKKV